MGASEEKIGFLETTLLAISECTHSGVVLVSNFFLGLHVPRVNETPSLGFFEEGLLRSEV